MSWAEVKKINSDLSMSLDKRLGSGEWRAYSIYSQQPVSFNYDGSGKIISFYFSVDSQKSLSFMADDTEITDFTVISSMSAYTFFTIPEWTYTDVYSNQYEHGILHINSAGTDGQFKLARRKLSGGDNYWCGFPHGEISPSTMINSFFQISNPIVFADGISIHADAGVTGYILLELLE